MFYKIENGKFVGFYEDKDKDGNYTEISLEDWQGVLNKQSQGEVIFYNSKSKKLETIKVGQFEELENGTAVYTAPGNTMGNYSSITNNFPITFPNKVLSIVITGFFDAGAAGDDGLECLHSVEGSSNSAFVLRATRLAGSTQAGHQGSAYYIAIGY